MKVLSSVQKGDSFEKKIFELFKDMLENGDLSVNPKRSRIYWKRQYYSEQRKKNIVFDIAIEAYQKDADTYSSLILFECKNYKHKVAVKEIEAFDSKLNQIGEHNTKGIIISATTFQKGALSLAKSKKMGVAILNGNKELGWVAHRRGKTATSHILSTINAQLIGEKNNVAPFFAFVDGFPFDNIPEMLVHLGFIDVYTPNEKYLKIDFKTEEDIDERISELNIVKCYDKFTLNIDRLCEQISELFNAEFFFTEQLGIMHLSNILGKVNYEIPSIYVNKDLMQENLRFRFTICHEIGHLALHYHLIKPYFDFTIDTELSVFHTPSQKINRSKLEIQANMFASQILLPRELLMIFVKNYFKKENIYKPHLLLDCQRCNQMLVYTLLNEISLNFLVSKEVARIRLKKLGLLIDTTENSLNDIFRRNDIRYNAKFFRSNEQF